MCKAGRGHVRAPRRILFLFLFPPRQGEKKKKKKTGKVAKKLKEVAKKCAKAKSKKACKKHAGCRHSKKKGCILA